MTVALNFMNIDPINSLSQLSIWIIIQDYPLSLITQGRWHSEIFEDAVQPIFANILRFTVPHGHPSQSFNWSHRTILSPHPLGSMTFFSPWARWKNMENHQVVKTLATDNAQRSSADPWTVGKGAGRNEKAWERCLENWKKIRCIRPPWNYRTVCPAKIKDWKMKFRCVAWVYFRELC